MLREWCRHGATATAYIEPGSPWQNPYVESFNARLRDELLNTEVFTCLEEAQVLAADWRADYNANHPHSALGMMSPERFAASLRSPSGLPTRGGEQTSYSMQTTPDSHAGWTDEWGPVTRSGAAQPACSQQHCERTKPRTLSLKTRVIFTKPQQQLEVVEAWCGSPH